MESRFWVIVSWTKPDDISLRKSIIILDRDSLFGQEYMYWNEEHIKQYYVEIFKSEGEVVILHVEEINDFRNELV